MMETGKGEDMAGTDDHDVPPASDMRRRGPVARLALTRRVVAALEPLEGAEIEADVENPALPPAAISTPRLRTDLLIRALDLRVRVALLPGADAAELNADQVLTEGLTMLIGNPETASVVVVADDEDLTCRIIEPFDRPDAIVTVEASESAETLPRHGPVATVIRAYLRQINPPWDPPPRVRQFSQEIESVALQAARDAISALQGMRKKAPEWIRARQGLVDEDAQWVRDRAMQVVLGESDARTLATRLDERAGREA